MVISVNIHVGGSGYLDTILKKLNYNLKYDIVEEIKNDYGKKTLPSLDFIQSGEMISKLP